MLLVAGSEGKTGAAALAADGAARIGAGLVSVACPAGLNDILEIKCTEAMTVPLPDTSERGLAASAERVVLDLAAERSAVGLGPGIGRSAETLKLVGALVPRLRKPLVIDADGLFAFAGEPERLAGRRAPTLLTPHPGEAGQLLGASPAEINRDRIAAARTLAERAQAVVLLKGAASVAASPDGRVVVNPTGGPALGSGGTGDVLTGVATGLLAQGMEAFEAAALAAFVHGAAADRIAAASGSSGLVASELARALPAECERPARGSPRGRRRGPGARSCSFLPRALRTPASLRACWGPRRRERAGGLPRRGPRRRQDRLREGAGRGAGHRSGGGGEPDLRARSEYPTPCGGGGWPTWISTAWRAETSSRRRDSRICSPPATPS